MSTATIDRRRFNVPNRTPKQRDEALRLANAIRVHRAQVKREIRTNWQAAVRALTGGDPKLQTMQVYDLLLAVPKLGTAKVNRMLGREYISPSKTIGGLTERQRSALVLAMARQHGGKLPLGAGR